MDPTTYSHETNISSSSSSDGDFGETLKKRTVRLQRENFCDSSSESSDIPIVKASIRDTKPKITNKVIRRNLDHFDYIQKKCDKYLPDSEIKFMVSVVGIVFFNDKEHYMIAENLKKKGDRKSYINNYMSEREEHIKKIMRCSSLIGVEYKLLVGEDVGLTGLDNDSYDESAVDELETSYPAITTFKCYGSKGGHYIIPYVAELKTNGEHPFLAEDRLLKEIAIFNGPTDKTTIKSAGSVRTNRKGKMVGERIPKYDITKIKKTEWKKWYEMKDVDHNLTSYLIKNQLGSKDSSKNTPRITMIPDEINDAFMKKFFAYAGICMKKNPSYQVYRDIVFSCRNIFGQDSSKYIHDFMQKYDGYDEGQLDIHFNNAKEGTGFRWKHLYDLAYDLDPEAKQTLDMEYIAVDIDDDVPREFAHHKIGSYRECLEIFGMTDTSYAKKSSADIKKVVKMFDTRSKSSYIWDPSVSLWRGVDKSTFISMVHSYSDNTGKLINNIIDSTRMTEEEKTKITKKFKKLEKHWDTNSFNKDFIDRIVKYIKDDKFQNKMNSSIDFPIKNKRLINMRTLETRDRTPSDVFDFESDVHFLGLDAETPHADKFFSDLFLGNQEHIDYFQKVLGYMISADTSEQVFFVFHGKGANGKSLVIDIINWICGKFCTTVGDSVFEAKSSGNELQYAMFDLIGKRCGFYSESETSDSMTINEKSIKRLSGEDTITCRQIYGSPVEFTPIIKLAVVTNPKPNFSGSVAMRRRLRYIPFKANFVDNPTNPDDRKINRNLKKNIKNEYIDEFFTWIVRGTAKFYEDGHLNEPEEFAKCRDEMIEEKDGVTAFITDCIVETKENKKELSQTRSNIWRAYQRYCGDDYTWVKKSKLFDRMGEQFKLVKDRKIGYYFQNIEVKRVTNTLVQRDIESDSESDDDSQENE